MKAKFSLLAAVNGKRITLNIAVRKPYPPEGATRFYLRYTDETGQRHDESVGSDFAHALAEIRTREARREYEEKTGDKLPLPEKKTEERPEPEVRGRTKLASQIETWLGKYQRANTLNNFRRNILQFQTSCGRKFLEEITRDDLFKFARALEAKGHAPQTVHTAFCTAMTFLKQSGIHLGIATKDWPSFDPRDVETYTSEELDALFLAATAEESALFKSFLFTGMRNQELAHVTYADIDFKHSIWSVRSKPKRNWKTKSKTGVRRIPVPPFHTEDIRERMIRHARVESDLVFPNERGEVHRHYIVLVHELAKRAGVTGRVDIHKFRSTCATMWLRDGVDMEEVRKRLGHSDYKMIQRYVEAWKLESKETMEQTTKTFARFDTIRS
jgi:integrase